MSERSQNGARRPASAIDQARIAHLHEKFPEVNLDDLEVAIAVARASVAIDRSLGDVLRTHHLTPVALQTLISVYLADGGPLSLTELGEQLRVTRANVSLVLGGLERHKLIRRRPDPGDGRKIRATVTKTGEKMLQEAIPKAVDALHSALEPLSQHDRSRLKALAQRVGYPNHG